MWRQSEGWRHASAALLFALLSIAMTWPLAPNLTRAVSDPGDPYILVWTLDWNWWATLRQPLELFHANVFHPSPYALALSENVYGISILLFPLRMLGMAPLTAYNVAMIGGFAFCGFAAYLLGSHLTRSWAAGLAAGVFYAFVPFRFVHLPHLQHVWGGWLPMMLFALLLYAEKPSRRRAAFFAAAFVMNGLTNIHYLFFGALAVAVTAVLLLPRDTWRTLAIATAIALAVLTPFLLPYAAVAKLYDLQRTVEDLERFSATLGHWLPHEGEPELRLHPGMLALVAAVAAFAVDRSRRARSTRWLALLWIAIGVAGSLGIHFEFHTFLYGAVPGFRAIRVPARWAVIAYIGLAILIAVATAALARRHRVAALLVPAVFVAHLWQAPIRWYLADPEPPAVHRWLAGQTLAGGVVELPMDVLSSDYEAMFRATAHHKPIVNGVSGFHPPHRMEISALSNATPVPDALVDRLRELRVELIIVHGDLLGARGPEVRAWLERELARDRISYVGRFDTRIESDWVFRAGGDGPRQGDDELAGFLRGDPPCAGSLMGTLDYPPFNMTFDRGTAIFSGWVVSHHGVRAVDLWFGNRRVRIPAELRDDPLLGERCAGRPGVTRKRFVAVIGTRPEKLRRETDVLVEVTDERGVATVYDNRWITWE